MAKSWKLRIRTVFTLAAAASGIALAANSAPNSTQNENAFQLFQQAQGALEKHEPSAAVVAYMMALIRGDTDHQCFPPAARASSDPATAMQVAASKLSQRIGRLADDPKTLSVAVSTLVAWNPDVGAGYDPGWKVASRCKDYLAKAKDNKEFYLKPMQDQSRLLTDPEYVKAYNVYKGVFHDYDSPPPDDAYSPDRVKAATEAGKTIIAIEKAKGVYYLSPAIYGAYRPLPFHVIATGHADAPINYSPPASVNEISGDRSNTVRLVSDATSFEKLWDAVYPGEKAMPKRPTVDFSTKDIVAVFIGQRNTTSSDLFVNRIDYDPSSNDITVYVRVRVTDEHCVKQEKVTYPFTIVAFDKPSGDLRASGYDIQNFPGNGC